MNIKQAIIKNDIYIYGILFYFKLKNKNIKTCVTVWRQIRIYFF